MNATPEEILDLCIERIRTGEHAEDILRQHPEVADEVRSLLTVAKKLEDLPEPAPSVGGMVRAMAKMTTPESWLQQSPGGHRIVRFARTFLMRAAAVLAVVLLLGWGTATAASYAMPGDFLYPVKLFTERVKFFLTVNAENKVELRIVFSEERLKEAIKNHERGGGIDKEVLKAMLDEAKMALETTPELSDVSRELLTARVAYLTEFQHKALERLKSKATPDEQRALAPFMDMCNRRCNWMRRGMRGESKSNDSSDPPAEQRRGWMDMCPMWR